MLVQGVRITEYFDFKKINFRDFDFQDFDFLDLGVCQFFYFKTLKNQLFSRAFLITSTMADVAQKRNNAIAVVGILGSFVA